MKWLFRFSRRLALVLPLVVLLTGTALSPSSASAQVVLRFDPPELDVQAGVDYVLSVWLDDAIDIRTFEVDIDYPPTMIESLGGEPGPLFSESGFFIFEVFDDTTPGHWHGAAVVLGSTDWLTGPGELYRWSFRALQSGEVPIAVPFVALYAPDATRIPGVQLEPIQPVDTETQAWGDIKALYR